MRVQGYGRPWWGARWKPAGTGPVAPGGLPQVKRALRTGRLGTPVVLPEPAQGEGSEGAEPGGPFSSGTCVERGVSMWHG
jgi:hypothetical protein